MRIFRLFFMVDDTTGSDPDLLNCSTGIVAERFDCQGPVSDRTILSYVVTGVIGQGGYSIVYRGWDTATGNPVAIKMLQDPDLSRRFKNEAKSVSRLDHDHIIQVHDIIERFQTVFIIMEYFSGTSIANLLADKKQILPRDAVPMLIQACRALAYAHDQGILHRDINPENLMLVENNRVKLMGFGSALPVCRADDLVDGAHAYLAPEVTRGKEASPQSDIYSLGITAYEMVVGRRPYPETDSALFSEIRCTEEIPDPGYGGLNLPQALQRFIVKACRIAPEERYQTAAEALCDLSRGFQSVPEETCLCVQNVNCFGSSHLGLACKTNEDRYLIRQMADQSLLLAVADGLGGDVSSDYAAEIVRTRLAGLRKLPRGQEVQALQRMARELDTQISQESQARPELEGMATTLVCAVLKQDHVHWINVGDSRLYLLRNQHLVQISQDQTLARFLVEEGELLPEHAMTHYSRDILDQCIGYGECEPETATFQVHENDLLILSTDGLYKMVPQKTIWAIVTADVSVAHKTKALIAAALDSGGKDNITVVLAKIHQVLP